MKKRRERRNACGVPGSRRLGSGGLGFTGILLKAFAGQLNQSRGRCRDQRSLTGDCGQT